MNKKGFISSTVIYTFLVLFILLIFLILNSYTQRDNMINEIKEDVVSNLES